MVPPDDLMEHIVIPRAPISRIPWVSGILVHLTRCTARPPCYSTTYPSIMIQGHPFMLLKLETSIGISI
jgi:hypothetical protein